jgi:branched-chain amino acid transport system permease protein
LDIITLAQSVLNGLMAGWIYILVALGLTLVLSILRIVQLAHGEIYMLGAYFAYYFCVSTGLNFFLALVISALLTGLLGIILERVFFRPFRGQFNRALISTLGLVLILQTIAIVGFGTSARAIPNPFPGTLTILGVTLSWTRLIIILISITLVSALLLFIRLTKIGQAMVAVSQDRDGAALQGIDINRISSMGMFVGCALAAVAGALVGSIFNVYPLMGGPALIKGIAVIILGGLGSIAGAIIGGLILGLIEGVVSVWLSGSIAGIISLATIVAILIWRPQGILGHE